MNETLTPQTPNHTRRLAGPKERSIIMSGDNTKVFTADEEAAIRLVTHCIPEFERLKLPPESDVTRWIFECCGLWDALKSAGAKLK